MIFHFIVINFKIFFPFAFEKKRKKCLVSKITVRFNFLVRLLVLEGFKVHVGTLYTILSSQRVTKI